MIFKRHTTDTLTPPIFADLAIQVGNDYGIVDVEYPGWLKKVRRDLRRANRVGLVMRGETKPRVWLTVNGDTPRYFSRIIGQIDEHGDRRQRVAAVQCGGVTAWLHNNGTVEVANEPTVKI